MLFLYCVPFVGCVCIYLTKDLDELLFTLDFLEGAILYMSVLHDSLSANSFTKSRAYQLVLCVHLLERGWMI